MSTLMHLDSQIGGTNVVNALDSDATTAALSAKQGKELNTNKADRTEIASASDVFDVNHIGGYAVGDIVIHNNVINVCQVAQAQGSVHTPTNTAGDTYWKISSVLDALKSSLAKSTKNYSDNNVTVRAKRINDIVSLDIFANNAGSTDYTVNQWNTIVTLEEKYKPTTGTVYPYIYNNATSDISKALITARILSDGKVQIYPVSGQTTLQLVGSISYIV